MIDHISVAVRDLVIAERFYTSDATVAICVGLEGTAWRRLRRRSKN